MEKILEDIVSLRRAKTRLAILDLLLKKGKTLKVSEIAKNLRISKGAVSVGLHYLYEDDLVIRVKRGYYKANIPRILRAVLPLITSDLFLDLLNEYREKIREKIKDKTATSEKTS
ncbi:MAG: ArsR family transcriptional regulator [Candidatus Korarchaeota archaeon]|nr:ArsR family transcriptional regulator [Candidatus Korarchaeota archaeon]NIU83132.1 ArsR family transcriptional regulator [Candidatus Thorarchaeota archaeon]NIW13506.1 ArsR family transcriptional regulator [Candidatus Thorarchaeota archaeon]NIW51604.1 ArsR family transcriptional regulator [Candidatus Korarchaeota archaeon]